MPITTASSPARSRRQGPAIFLAGLVAAASGAVPGAAPAAAQSPIALEHRTTFHEAFGLLQTVRELSDGRVVVADPLGRVLVAVDLRSGAMTPIGREGRGPGEWLQPDAVHALPGDSTLVVDLGNARLAVYDGAGRYVEGHPMMRVPPSPSAGGSGGPGGPGGPAMRMMMDVIQPRATDAAGRVYYQGTGGMAGPGSAPDSSQVRRWDRGEGEPAVLARLRPPVMAQSTSGGRGDVRVTARPVPLSPQDDWAVAPDGRVAVVRAEPYRVEWRHPNGRVVQGPAVQYRPVRLTQGHKERWVEALSSTGLSMAMTVENGSPSMRMGRGGGGRPPGATGGVDDYEWPDVLPAFRARGSIVAPDGTLWVERYGAADGPVVYDLFDDQGRRARRVSVRPHSRVIGFGRDAVYAARMDDLGLNWLEVYAPPR